MKNNQIIKVQNLSIAARRYPARQTKPQLKYNTNCPRGFTLLELIIVVAILGVLAAMVLPSYTAYVTRAKNGRAKSEIRLLEIEINGYSLENEELPANLAMLNRGDLKDPWGRPYVYSNIPTRIRFGVLLNDDFDLFSMGADGATPADGVVATGTGQDDLLRGSNGTFIGLATDW